MLFNVNDFYRKNINVITIVKISRYGTSIVRTILYVTILIAIIIFLIIDTTESRYRLISIIGIITIIGLGWIFSKHPGQASGSCSKKIKLY